MKVDPAARYSPRWWLLVFVHNSLVHQFLFFAEVCDAVGLRRVAAVIFWAHDHTVPKGGG